MNYLKSEGYRFIRKHEFYWVSVISLGLVVAAIAALYFVGQAEKTFPYATNRFLYLNVLTTTPLISVIGLLIDRQLLGKDQKIIKQIVCFGISRKAIFFVKLLLTSSAFLLLCGLGLAITFVGGEYVLQAEAVWRTQYVVAVINLIPIVLSSFILGHSLMLTVPNEVYCVPIAFFLLSSWTTELVAMLENTLFGSTRLTSYLPSAQITQITNDFLAQKAVLLSSSWLVGLILSAISLLVGLVLFDKKEI